MTEITEKKIEEWTDEEVLENLSKFLERVTLTSQFVEQEDGLLTHQMLVLRCGDKAIISDPLEMEWPLQKLPVPEAFKGKLN